MINHLGLKRNNSNKELITILPKTPNGNQFNFINNILLTKKTNYLLNLSKNNKKLDKIKYIINLHKTYNSFKINNCIYYINDIVLIFGEPENLIGKIIKIIPNNGLKEFPFWPCVLVSWCYTKKDLNRKKNNLLDKKNYDSISDYELFPTNHKDIIYIESIITKLKVYTYEQYEELNENNELTDLIYFSRAKYDSKSQLLIPRFKDWKKSCVCQRPLNPDQLYIKCDICLGWFHPECCNIDKNIVHNIKIFYCPNCDKNIEKDTNIIIVINKNQLTNIKNNL